MKRAASLRVRLVVLVGGGLLALLLAQYVSTAMVLNEREEDMIDALLAEQMQYGMQLYNSKEKSLKPNIYGMAFYAFKVGHPGSDVPAVFLPYAQGNYEVDIGATEYHFLVHDENGVRFLVTYNAEAYENHFLELMVILGVAFLLSAVLAIIGIYWLSGRVLQNLTQLGAALHRADDKAFFHADMEAEVGAVAIALDNYRAHQTLLLERERDFSGYLSHELRTPLSVVRARAEIMAMQYPHESRLQTNSAEIIAAVDRMRAMIEQLLYLARHAYAPHREEVRLYDLVNRIWSDLAAAGGSQTSLLNSLPVDVVVVTDPLLLELILRNAFANARQHANGAELRVCFDDNRLVIEDFSEPALSVFELDGDDGGGLGLAILRRACAVLGWSCQITTLPTGTRLSLHIP